jgi:energy-coupling factor transporter ATP-binding protein EcfA2
MSETLYMDPETPTGRPPPSLPLIKIVGVSGSGKSTLARSLREAGYNARPVGQEHSHIPHLWQQFDPPSILLYLEADLACQQRRRPDVTWTAENLQEERARLAHAFAHADLTLDTSQLAAAAILTITQAFLAARQVRHHDRPLAPPSESAGAVATARQTTAEVVKKPRAAKQKKRGARN